MALGSEHDRYLGHRKYKLDRGSTVKYSVDPILQHTERSCKVHGSGCLGHIESNKGQIFMPSNMTPSSNDVEHPLMVAKSRTLTGRISYSEYQDQVVRYMRSKTGYIRSMNSIAVEGSLKMVISPAPHSNESQVYVPHHIANSTKVPHVENGVVVSSSIKDGDYGILVRQPVLWHGGIRSCKIRVLNEGESNSTRQDVESSMKFPISMCSSFAADFDGDEMSLFPVKSPAAIKECKVALWDNTNMGPYVEEDYNTIVPSIAPIIKNKANTLAIATTVCWSDRRKGHKITHVHSKWLTSVPSFVAMNKCSQSPLDFVQSAMDFMSSSTTKSSLQSNIGATSRRSKNKAEGVYLDSCGCLRYQTGQLSTIVPTQSRILQSPKDGYFGNPTVRAVSKLCRASMQITLKVKSSSGVSDISPTLSLLSGSTKWLRILHDGSIHIVSKTNIVDYDNVRLTCSLFDIARSPEMHRIRLLKSFMYMVCLESRCTLDPAEYECLLQLMLFLVNTNIQPSNGIESDINKYYGEFHTLSRWNMCYATIEYYDSTILSLEPTTLVECMMLGDFSSVPSISRLSDLSI